MTTNEFQNMIDLSEKVELRLRSVRIPLSSQSVEQNLRRATKLQQMAMDNRKNDDGEYFVLPQERVLAAQRAIKYYQRVLFALSEEQPDLSAEERAEMLGLPAKE